MSSQAWTAVVMAALATPALPSVLLAQTVERPLPVDVEAAPRPEAWATRTAGPITLDGVLDEAAWATAPVITGFVQARPDRGHPASEHTEARILYDDEKLYVGVELGDREPDKLVIPSLEQDFETGNSDIFGISLDTFLDRRNAFMLLVNPKGAVKEAQDFDDSRQENAAWEGIFEVRTTIHERGWTVEWAIPFTTLRFDPRKDPQDWGMNLMRRIRRKNEESYWAPLDQRDRIHKMSKAGTLRGLEGLRPGRNLIVKPYAVGSHAGGGAVGSADGWARDAGLDVKYGITPRLTLDLTLRTDFSQVEVDQERVNLTRFSLFFPERRDFFTENSGVFSFGDITERNYRSGSSLSDFTLFHSRRIGLDAAGQEIPIVGGGRLTGRAAGFEIGVLDMQTDAAQGLPDENFAVLRAKRTVGGVGDFGAIAINRQATDGSGSFNRTYGFEANLAPHPNVRINSYLAGVDDSADGPDWAGRLWAGWRDPFWNLSAGTKRVGEEFSPRVGFVRRRGVQQSYATAGVHMRPPSLRSVSEINPFTEVEYTADLDGRLLTHSWTTALEVDHRSGGSVGVQIADEFERLDEPFTVAGGAVVPAGDHAFRTAALSVGTSAGRPLWTRVRVSKGSFYNGDRTSVSLSGQLRVDYRLSLDYSAERNALSIPGFEDFAANVYGARLTYAASTRFFTSAFVQRNALTRETVTNVRVNYLHAPLSDLFLVYTERRDGDPATRTDRLISFKVTKAVAF
ncbi:MAG: carbohydrate binding family 9 domain-containing protein [Longimicrobiales bacterium]